AAAETWTKAAFQTHGMDDTLKALGDGKPVPSMDVVFFSTPDIAENGAVVPIGIASKLPNTESIAILVEKNPNMLAAVFDVPPGTEPSLTTRVKMRETSNVYALVKAGGGYYMTSKEIKVTLGGCGG
ncbi:MAG: thiosulfate oxidation carrier protein SoxY, partial [Casimicrobiaceae bacterium]